LSNNVILERAMGIESRSEDWDRIGNPGFLSLHIKKMIAHAAKSNRKSMERLLHSILAPGTIRTSAE